MKHKAPLTQDQMENAWFLSVTNSAALCDLSSVFLYQKIKEGRLLAYGDPLRIEPSHLKEQIRKGWPVVLNERAA